MLYAMGFPGLSLRKTASQEWVAYFPVRGELLKDLSGMSEERWILWALDVIVTSDVLCDGVSGPFLRKTASQEWVAYFPIRGELLRIWVAWVKKGKPRGILLLFFMKCGALDTI